MGNYLTTRQVAAKLQINISKLYELLRTGALAGYRLGKEGKRRHWRIAESDLEKFIKGEQN